MGLANALPHWAVVALIVSAVVTPALPARAAGPATAQADGLYQRAQELASAGRYAEALPLFEQSQQLDPALGTQFAIAECHEKTGREALAYRAYVELQRRAHEAGKPKIEQRSQERIAALGPRVPRLRVRLDPADADAVITVDGEPNVAGEIQVVDPGAHTVRVIAPSRKAWEQRPVAAPGATLDVVVPKLAVVDAVAAKHDPVARRSIGVVTALSGVGLVAAGGIFGGVALSKRGDAAAACPDRAMCSTQAQADAWSSAAGSGTVSTVLVIVGVAALGTGISLYLSAPRPAAARVAAASLAVAGGLPLQW